MAPLDAGAKRQLRAAYSAETQELARGATGLACRLAIAVILAFGAFDPFLVPPEVFRAFAAMRLACTGVLGAVLWLLGRPSGARHPYALGVLIGIVVGLMISLLTVYTGGAASPRYAGLYVLLVGGALIMPWGAGWAAVASAAIIGAYAATTLATDHTMEPRAFGTHLLFLVATATVAIFGNTFRERLRWREFQSRAALAESLRQRSDFLAKMSHELRTPVHVAIGYAEMLLDDGVGGADGAARGLIERIRKQAVLLDRLVSDVLDYSKAYAGKLDAEAESIVPADVVAHIAEAFRPLAERKGLALSATCEADVPVLTSDRQRLVQILTNLVGNAVKFTHAGRVWIEVRRFAASGDVLDGFVALGEPRASRGAEREAVVVLVGDTGIGLRSDDVPRLAVDFVQVGETAARYGGTGLGLSISRKLAHVLGGEIRVRSRHGEGSVFALVLPVDMRDCRAAA